MVKPGIPSLIGALAVDAFGMVTPGFIFDIGGIISGIYIWLVFKRPGLALASYVEESVFPFDIVPTATIIWFAERFRN